MVLETESDEASVDEVFLGARALAVAEDSEDQPCFTGCACDTVGDLSDYVFLPLFVEVKSLDRFADKFPVELVQVHYGQLDLNHANLGVSLWRTDHELVVD